METKTEQQENNESKSQFNKDSLKPRKDSGIIRVNLDGLRKSEADQLSAIIGKTATKEQATLYLLKCAKIVPDSGRSEASPDKVKLEANIKALDAHIAKLEATTGTPIKREQLKAIIDKCPDKKIAEALSHHYFKVEVAPKSEEFSFTL